MELVPDPSPWIDSKCACLKIPIILPADELGLEYQYDFELGRCKIIRLVTDSPAGRHIRQSNVIGNYILMINGQSVQTPDEVDGAITSYITLSHQYEERLALGVRPRSADGYAAALQGVIILICKSDRRATDMIDELDLNKQDLGTSRMVWAIGMIGAISTHRDKKAAVIPRFSATGVESSALDRLDSMDDLEEDFLGSLYEYGVASISGMSDPARKCPTHWKVAMKTPEGLLWIQALHDHLEKCYINGTYGIRQEPPSGARVIPPVIALKHLHNVVKQIDERNI